MKLNRFLFGAMAAGVLASCGDMEYHEDLRLDRAYIDRNFEYVGGLMNAIYTNLDTDFGNFSGAMLSSATDESEYSTSGNTIENFYNGGWSAANPMQTMWNKAYEGITYCNEVLDNWQGLTFPEFEMDKDYAKKMHQYQNYQYEARWARAYFYYSLVRQYGGVPFKVHNSTGSEETSLPRTSADEIFAFIDSECAAIQNLIVKDYTDLGDMAYGSPEKGRANMFAVMALRAQAALYHASPLFNPGNNADLWHKAATACRDLIDSCELGNRHTLAADYTKLWGNSSNEFYSDAEFYKEVLFGRRVAASNSFEGYNFPVGYSSGKGGNCPTQDLVDAYNMTNGMMIDEAGSGYDAQDPYANRDPRFEMTVAHNGDAWPKDISNTSYATLQTYVGGYHARPRTSYATPSSYYLKKLCNTSQILRSGYSTTSAHVWLTFRTGAAYLNYAEALFQYFKAQGNANAADATDSEFPHSAREMASKTRQRVGMPAFATGMSNTEFWTRYKNERMVELAFEGHRFYDVRRWKEDGDKFMNIHRMEITQNITTDANDNEVITYSYNVVPFTRGNGQWQEKWNLFPIPQTEVMKSGSAITQNPGW